MKRPNKLAGILATIAVLLFSLFSTPKSVGASCAPNHIIYVASSGSGAGGCTWATAFQFLQDAITLATSGDQIWVANGTYYPDQGAGQINNDRNSTFTLKDGVSVYGGFTVGDTLLTDRDSNPATNGTVLSGDIDQIAGNANNAYTVVTTNGFLTDTYVLDGFTITGGNQNSGSGVGGGMYIQNTSPMLANLIITANSANGRGGGVFIISVSAVEANYSNTSFTDVTISNNTAGIGGGVYVQNGSPSFTRVTFTGNSSTGGAGGGLNVQTLGGPGVDEPNLPTLVDVIFTSNTSVGGGGMFNNNSQSALNRVTFDGNTATRRGGGMLNEFSSPALTNVTFSGNISTETSGAMPWGGGGMMNIGADPVLNNVTFNGNNSVNGSGTAGGDAIKNVTQPGNASTPVIENSILWGDGGINDEVRNEGTSSATIEDSIVQGGCPALATCANVINLDPVLSALANNGGYTQTMAISVTGAADNAADTTTADCAASDQRGTARPQGVACDIGAYEIDDTGAPTLISFTLFNPATSPTNFDTLVFRATFSETVINVSAGDFQVFGTTTATVTLVTPISGTVYEITVSGGDLATFNGVVGINLSGAQNITDAIGNALPAGEPATDETYLVDNIAPTVTIDQAIAQADPTNVSPINFTVVFSEATTNFATGDVTLGGTAGATTAIVTGGPITFNVAVSGMAGDGTVIATLAAGVATDAAGNNSIASTSTDNTVTFDATAPTVTIDQAIAQPDPTNVSPINFTVVFSEATTTFATGDVTLGGTAGATTAIVTGGPITFNVAVSGMTGDGTVIATIAAGVATDAAGNNNTASTSTDNTVIFDQTAPTVTIDQALAQVDPTSVSPINFTVVFSEATTTFATGDVTLGGTAGATIAIVTGGPITFNVAVSGMTGDGTVIATIAAGVATDAAGNNNAASSSTDNTVTYDATGPSVTIDQALAQADPTSVSPINFTVVFSEATTNFATGDVTLSGTAGATTSIVTGGPITFNVAVSGMAGDGTVIATIAASVATDALGNGNTASTSTDNTVTYDTTAPTVTIDQALAQLDPTGASPINFTVVFSEATTTFATGDVTLGGTAGATTAIVTGGPTTYNVAVSGMTGDGTVIATIAAGVATDAAGNGNAASTSTDNTVTYDTSGPIVTIGAPSVAVTSIGPVNFPITITGGTTFNLTVGDITLNTTGSATGTVTVTNGNTANPTVTITGITGNGTIGISIAAGVASDGSGNTSPAAGPSTTFIVDNSGPIVTASVPANTATVTGPTQLIVTYNEDVKNDGSAGAANNVVNYLLVEAGVNTAFDTLSCLGGAVADDTVIAINTATYTNNGGSGPFVATLDINGGIPLPVGTYQLYVCGTTSIENLANLELNDGLVDTIIRFTVIAGAGGGGGDNQRANDVPATGFPQGMLTTLPLQPAEKAYTATGLWIEIPRLGVKMNIVGIPQAKDGWDVSWLGREAGWLNGSAFPTWQGNSVLTGHVWTETNKPGPFNKLKNLQYGDQIKIHAFGQVFIYEIRESALISATDTKSMMKHEEKTWLTLITCEGFNARTGEYLYRRMARAVLVSVVADK